MREVFLTLSLLLVLTSPALGGNATPTSGDCLSNCQEWIKVYEGKSEDIHKAIDDINKTIEVKPDADFYTLHELLYIDKGLYDRAVADINKAFANINKVMVKTDAEFCTLRGLVYIGKGCYDEAIDDINKAFADTNKAINLNL